MNKLLGEGLLQAKKRGQIGSMTQSHSDSGNETDEGHLALHPKMAKDVRNDHKRAKRNATSINKKVNVKELGLNRFFSLPGWHYCISRTHIITKHYNKEANRDELRIEWLED